MFNRAELEAIIMLPLLYRTTNTIPSRNSMQFIGRLTKVIKCQVSQIINGNYELSAVIAPTDELVSEIRNQRFIMAKPNFTDNPQYFEIYNQSIAENGQLTIKARHIKHCCYNNLIRLSPSDGAQSDTPQGHWDFVTDPLYEMLSFTNNFSFSTNITAHVSMEIGYTKSDTLGMFLEEIAAKTGGEFHYDNYDISLLTRIGTTKQYALRWGKNIGSPTLTLSGATVYTHVVAYVNLTAKYTMNGTDYEYPVQICSDPQRIPNTENYLNKIYLYDASDTFFVKRDKTIDPTTMGPVYDAYRLILSYEAAHFISSTKINQVQTAEDANLKVTIRQALDEMKELALGDTVNIILRGGQTVEARITKTVFDSLAERWENLEIGQQRLILSKFIAKTR